MKPGTCCVDAVLSFPIKLNSTRRPPPFHHTYQTQLRRRLRGAKAGCFSFFSALWTTVKRCAPLTPLWCGTMWQRTKDDPDRKCRIIQRNAHKSNTVSHAPCPSPYSHPPTHIYNTHTYSTPTKPAHSPPAASPCPWSGARTRSAAPAFSPSSFSRLSLRYGLQ